MSHIILKSSLYLAALAVLTVSPPGATRAEAQSAQQQPPPAVRQFGPRVAPPRQQPGQPQAGAQGRKPDVIGKHGDWTITCEQVKPNPQADEVKLCQMIQSASHEEHKQLGVVAVIARVKRGDEEGTMMRVIAPIGVWLPGGVGLEIDGNAINRVPYDRCDPRSCAAMVQVRPETVDKLKAGGKATFTVYIAPGKSFALDVSLQGFTAGYEELAKLSTS